MIPLAWVTVTHAAIIKKAKQKGWTRNLAGKVQTRIKEKLVTYSVTDCNQSKKLSDHDMVEQAGMKTIKIDRAIQADLRPLSGIGTCS